MDEHDRLENYRSLKNGYGLLSAYSLKNGTNLWVSPEEDDRSATTLLLPDEY